MATLIDNSVQKAFTTLARAKSFLEISGDSKDTLLTMLINQITGFIEAYTKRNFLSQTYTNEEYDGSGTSTIVLRQFPVTAVSSVQVNTSGDSSDAWQTINSINYFWDADGRIRLNNPVAGFLDQNAGTFLDDPQKYRVSYTAGYKIDFSQENTPASHNLPQEIEYVTLKLLSKRMNTRKGEGLSSAKVGDISMSFRAGVEQDPEVKEILEKYASATI